MVERVKTGIGGLDGMIEGGIKKNNTILIVGGCGTGKSTFGMQYLYNGALEGEPGLFVTFEEDPEQIRENMMRHGWDLETLDNENKLKIMRVKPQEVRYLIKDEYNKIQDAITTLGAKRVVLDSLTSVELMIENEFDQRESVLNIIKFFQKNNCTNVMIAESEQDPKKYSRHGIIEFIVDGVVILYSLRRGKSRVRALEVLKMRGTNQSTNLVPFILENGISIQPHLVVYSRDIRRMLKK